MKVAVIGPLCKDTIFIEGNRYEKIGSIPYYVGMALKNLGVNVTIYGTAHKDDEAFFRKELGGITYHHIPVEGTIEVEHYYELDVNKRKQKVIAPDNTLHLENFDFDMSIYDYIILGPLFQDNISKELIEKLSSYNAKLVLGNFGLFTHCIAGEMVWRNSDKLLAVLKHCDYLFLDEDEANHVSGKKNIDETIDFLKKEVSTLIITKGSRGSIIISDKKYEIPAFKPKELIDPTGAGDTYLAAYIAAINYFEDEFSRGRFAAMTATITLENEKGFDKDKEEVLSRLNSIN